MSEGGRDSMDEVGLPSFEEFKRNRNKWIKQEDEDFGLVDQGPQSIKRCVQKHIYEIEGYRCKSLEEVERVAASQGIPIHELDYRPQLIPMGAGKCDVLVKFVPKHTRMKREAWG